jgi:hypothetical protein
VPAVTSDNGRLGAAAGAGAVLLFVTGGLIAGTPPDFSASGAEVAEFLSEQRTRLQVGIVVSAASTPLLIWFLATVAALTREAAGAAERAGSVAFGCGIAFVSLYLADLAALAVGALRPQAMASAPELATALHDFSWMAPALAAIPGAFMLASLSTISLGRGLLWPRWIGWLAALAAGAYALRAGALFTTDGPFAADGLLGFWVPVVALAGWLLLAGLSLARDRAEP